MIPAKKIGRIVFRSLIVLLCLFMLMGIVLFAPALKNRWVDYPNLKERREAIHSTFQEAPAAIPLDDYKGVLHSHSYWSHDSRGMIEEILPAAKKANLDFIFLSDHKRSQADTFPRGIHGLFDGILIEAGTESNGMMVTPLDTTILDWTKKNDEIIDQVVEKGGMTFYVHSEEPHDWGNEGYTGMEIYNIHTDLKDETGLLPFVLNSVVNGKRFRHWAYRELFDEQDKIWALWDSLNQHRKIVGIAAVDAHNNQNFRARYLPDGKVEWVGPNAKTLEIVAPGLREKLLLGEPDTAGWVFNWGLDTYFHSFNYVNTHVFADTLSNTNLRDHLVKGHAYIAFESLSEAKGFQFFALDYQGRLNGIMGDSIPSSEVSQLKAYAPYPVQFRLMKDGKLIDQNENVYEYNFSPNAEKGNYRLVASLYFDKEWVLWIMTNPIYIF